MASKRRCFADGMLVSNQHWIPRDAVEFGATASIIPAVGCNRLHCAQCGESVRSIAGRALAGADSTPLSEIFDADNAEQHPALRDDSPSRLYLCRCHSHTERNTQSLDGYDELHLLRLPWACAGHPRPRFPLRLDDVRVSLANDDATLRLLLTARLLHDVHPQINQLAGFQAVRVYRLIEKDTARRDFALRVADLLVDPDPSARRGALGFYRLCPTALGAERVLKLARKRSMWSATDPEDDRVTLHWTLKLTLEAIRRVQREGA